jgi:UrcA family protein
MEFRRENVMRTSTLSAFVVAALGAGLAATAGATTARSVDVNGTETARTTVHYGDLDVHTRQGADELYTRINTAAGRVCGDVEEPYVRLTRAFEDCRHNAISAAVQEINAPLVTQTFDQHAAKFGETTAHHATSNRAPHA